MRLATVETFPVALPFREPYVTATGTLTAREMVLVRIRDDDGAEGWGDAVPMTLRGGDGLARVRSDLARAGAEVLAGADLDPGDAGTALLSDAARLGTCPPALAALDMALLDLCGRVDGKPAWELLGAEDARPVACNGTLGADEPATIRDAAARLSGEGFATLKVKVGTGEDRERVAAVREGGGPAVLIRVDANRAWDVERAVEELAAMAAEWGLELAEQPCADVEELAEVRARTDVPIVADESVATAADAARARDAGACDAVTIKLAKVGGPRRALELAEILPSYLSSALDSPLGIAAAVATAQALPERGYAHGLSTSALFAENVAEVSGLIGPSLEPSGLPGLGVEVDEGAVRRLVIG